MAYKKVYFKQHLIMPVDREVQIALLSSKVGPVTILTHCRTMLHMPLIAIIKRIQHRQAVILGEQQWSPVLIQAVVLATTHYHRPHLHHQPHLQRHLQQEQLLALVMELMLVLVVVMVLVLVLVLLQLS